MSDKLESNGQAVVAITGAARGIGAEIARRCVTQNMNVLISDIDDRRGEYLAVDLRAAGHQAIYQHADVSREQDLVALIDRVAALWGRLDLLVNNAHWEVQVPLTELTADQWDRSQAVLVRSHMLAAKYAAPLMRAQGGGNIINLGSVHGFAVTPHYATYEAGKAAVIHLTRQLARDLGPDGIRVNCICPGYIMTEENAAWLAERPGYEEFYRSLHPVGRLGTTGDVAELVLFLASPAASFITGQPIVIDGGQTLEMSLTATLRIWEASRR